MFGLFGRFGRSSELRELDRALRSVDLHPALVPDAVELTAVRLMKQHDRRVDPESCASAARLMAYCMVGPGPFLEANGDEAADGAGARIEAAAESGDGLDADLILLLLHAGLVQPEVIARYSLEMDRAE